MELELVLSLRPELSQDLSPGEEFVSLCLVQCSGSLYGVKVSIIILQLNLHVTDLLFPYLSHHLTWHCLLICDFSPVSQFLFVVIIKLFCTDMKIKNKNNLVIMLRKSWEILRNLQKSTNNFMSIVANI